MTSSKGKVLVCLVFACLALTSPVMARADKPISREEIEHRLEAEEAYVRQLKTIPPAGDVLRAYQIETRLNALYLAVVFDTVPLTH